MRTLNVTASKDVAAPPEVVYDLIADYRKGHPSILPPEYFEDLVVEEGGRGAGTRIRFTMKAFGRREVSRALVTEPEPGRVLVETVEGSGIVTTFTVDPTPTGARVTFDTSYPVRGLGGWLQGLVVPGYLRKVYRAELRLLATRAEQAARSRSTP
ncbi:MAG: SRPBCC family protein [Gemmatimonadales bacterium]